MMINHRVFFDSKLHLTRRSSQLYEKTLTSLAKKISQSIFVILCLG